MGGESRYEIHQNAYIKLLLHALKHRTSGINAVLLGRSAAVGVEIVESVPYSTCRSASFLPLRSRSLCWITKSSSVCIWGKTPSPVLQMYTKDASSSRKLAGTDGSSQLVLKVPSANVVLTDYIPSEKWKDIVDFDDHLNDISKDWMHSELFD